MIKQIHTTLNLYIELSARNAKAQEHLNKLLTHLDKAGTEAGKPNWKYNAKGDAFLRIVRPAVDGKAREFIYIGAKADKIADAFASTDRQRQKEEISDELSEARMQGYILKGAIGELSETLDSKLSHAANHYDLSIMTQGVDVTGGRDQIYIEHIRPTRAVTINSHSDRASMASSCDYKRRI
jgi:hypothetical protein